MPVALVTKSKSYCLLSWCWPLHLLVLAFSTPLSLFSILGMFSRWFLTLALAFSLAFSFSLSWMWSLKALGELQFVVLEFLQYGGKGYYLLFLGVHGLPLVLISRHFELVQSGCH